MKAGLRRLARRLPPRTRSKLHRIAAGRGLRRRVQPVRWGNLRRVEPRARHWGSERGTPVDRHYIDAFFREHASAITGRVLEVRDPRYASSLGNGVTSVDIVDIDPRNDEATIIVDLSDPGSLPAGRFDCAIVPQTLVYVRDPFTAAANLWQSLAPGGTLLISSPAICRLDSVFASEDRWHLTPAGLQAVMDQSASGAAEIRVTGRGNVLVAVAFLHGIAEEELSTAELAFDDPLFPIVVTAFARKSG
ncbi:MAG TPA: hypothetical protein VG265_07560 [Gaiellaceae bacterium]|nr:hypothetical protein [Gaiellaceae bacterium]